MLLNLQSVCFIVYVVKNYVNPNRTIIRTRTRGGSTISRVGGKGQRRSTNLFFGQNIPENCMKMKTICNQLYRLRFAHQFQAEMPEAKVSWLLCLGSLVSKIDNAMHLLHLLGKISKWSDDNLWFSEPLSFALGMTGYLGHCLVKQAWV